MCSLSAVPSRKRAQTDHTRASRCASLVHVRSLRPRPTRMSSARPAPSRKLSESPSIQPFCIDNRPPARAATLGTELWSKRSARRRTPCSNNQTGSHNTTRLLIRKLPYERIAAISRQFRRSRCRTAGAGGASLLPAKTLPNFSLARARPAACIWLGRRRQHLTHLSGEMLISAAKIKLTHVPTKVPAPRRMIYWVPYRIDCFPHLASRSVDTARGA
jgi:hypothetical protein